ncbi:hypothetical protein V6N13_114213 [Hibiscus sabdariffa]|uniref:Uncharacterized protein n=1 Tax=Hibiscus sabdariffa TaxID=183260 RepID=A0ABR2U171_9ROSI
MPQIGTKLERLRGERLAVFVSVSEIIMIEGVEVDFWLREIGEWLNLNYEAADEGFGDVNSEGRARWSSEGVSAGSA